LDGIFAVKVGHRQALSLEDPEHVLQRAAHKENLLTEPQPLALLQFVVGIEHLGEGFRLHLLQHGPGVVPGIEGGKVEGVRGLGRPQPQGIGGVYAAAEDRGVVGNPYYGVAADLNRVAPFRSDHLPGIAAGQPGVGALLLPFWADLLAENAKFVADAVADGGQLQAGHRFLKAGRQATQAAIAQARFRLLSNQLFEREVHAAAGRFGIGPDTQVDQVVLQVGSEQVFGR